MSDNNTSSPTNTGYTHTGSGTNSWGNHWFTRQDSNGDRGYHYSNSDGDYYYKNFDGSEYFNDGRGNSTYTTPGGQVVQRSANN